MSLSPIAAIGLVDASRGVFTYQLPAIKASNATPDGGDLSATITVMDSTTATRRPANDHTAIAPSTRALARSETM